MLVSGTAEQTNVAVDWSDLLESTANEPRALTAQEQTVLRLWDQEKEVCLEMNLLKSQIDYSIGARDDGPVSDASRDQLQAQITTAERELLEARTSYLLRNKIIQNVLIVDPVLKAIHAGSAATPLETRLLPLIKQRDVTSMIYGTMSTELQAKRSRLATLQGENEAAIAANKSLAATMLALANELKTNIVPDVQDSGLQKQLDNIVKEAETARREWRLMKSLVGNIVVESGVAWAKDPKLLELVLDTEDEMISAKV